MVAGTKITNDSSLLIDYTITNNFQLQGFFRNYRIVGSQCVRKNKTVVGKTCEEKF